ncbi:MAG: Hpt domain [Gemmatimonadota bacterium]
MCACAYVSRLSNAADVAGPLGDGEGVFDPSVLRAFTGDDAAFFRELAEEFARSARTTHAELEAVLAADDFVTLALVAHRFKSAAGQVGALGAQELAASLERIGRAGGAGASRAAGHVASQLLPMLRALEAGLLAAAEAAG